MQPLTRFGALQSVVSKKLATYSVRRSHLGLPVSRGPSRSSRPCRPPSRLRVVGSSSPALSVLHRVRFRLQTAVRTSRTTPPLRFGSPSRHPPIESTCGGFRHHPRSALSVPPTLSGFLLDVLHGFVSPQSRVQDSPFRGFPHHPASTARRCFLPSSCSPSLPADPKDCASTQDGTFKVLLQLVIRHTHQRV